ncbi:MAG: ribosome-binding factor A [Acidimicrobiales bacterium]
MPSRGWSRLDRVNEALREVLAEELALIDDDRLQLVTVTGVAADPDLRRAKVWFSALSVHPAEPVEEVLGGHRRRLQAAIGAQLRLKRTPELTFQPDPAIAVGTRVEDIIRGFDALDSGESGTGDAAAPGSSPGQGGEPR